MTIMQDFVQSKSGVDQRIPTRQARDLTAPLTGADRRRFASQFRIETNTHTDSLEQANGNAHTGPKIDRQAQQLLGSELDPTSAASEDPDDYEESFSDMDMVDVFNTKHDLAQQFTRTVQPSKSVSKAEMQNRMMGRPATPQSYPTTTASISRTSSHDGRSEKHNGQPVALPSHHSRNLGDRRNQEHSDIDSEPWSTQSAGEQSNINDDSMPPATNGHKLGPMSVNRNHLSKQNGSLLASAPKHFPGLTPISPPRPVFNFGNPHEKFSSSTAPGETSNDKMHDLQHQQRRPVQPHNARQSLDGTVMNTNDADKSVAPMRDIQQSGSSVQKAHHSRSSNPPARLSDAVEQNSKMTPESNPKSSCKTSGLSEMSDLDEGSSPESDAGLDYTQHELFNKDFTSLQSEIFDRKTMPQDAQLIFAGNETELRIKLEEALKSRDQDAKESLLHSLDIDQWEQAGSWFVDKQTEFLKKVMAIRRAKRAVALKHEALIRERHDIVADRRELIRAQKEALKTAGVALLNAGTPKKRKAPGTPHMGPPPPKTGVAKDTGKTPSMATEAGAKAGRGNATNAETTRGPLIASEDQEMPHTDNGVEDQNKGFTSTPAKGNDGESQPPEA
ncbi:extracellular mutant protein 11-domain-containing protein [Elsinoe ampelina]|uniref:Extracellular mutant protein 11-domain-containing protein n=1 Tax=Elsinoe ampelina TaxID=302913 RepID=A0A6A6G1N6_9PEZI|nr:extracellular mutant protein 11-domain-containing protein [Elsinoe ampelina]